MPITNCVPRRKEPSNWATTWVHFVLQLQLLLICCKRECWEHTLGVLFLDTFMKEYHILNIALHWHAHLALGSPAMCDSRLAVSGVPVSLDIVAWNSLCFR
jgi:hypothetical protein